MTYNLGRREYIVISICLKIKTIKSEYEHNINMRDKVVQKIITNNCINIISHLSIEIDTCGYENHFTYVYIN